MHAVILKDDNCLDGQMQEALVALERRTYEERFPEGISSEVYHIGTKESCEAFIKEIEIKDLQIQMDIISIT